MISFKASLFFFLSTLAYLFTVPAALLATGFVLSVVWQRPRSSL